MNAAAIATRLNETTHAMIIIREWLDPPFLPLVLGGGDCVSVVSNDFVDLEDVAVDSDVIEESGIPSSLPIIKYMSPIGNRIDKIQATYRVYMA